ncbi:MAG: hypothetical protein HY587_00780 [Candidatus Omnitrophica bacterium]|nr:hypothetical protein [Candidatus Omnitrophota bacterium]
MKRIGAIAVRGALLIEVLFAITLLVFGITACLRAMGQGLEITKRSQEYAKAELAVDDLIFRLLSGAEETLLMDGGSGKLESPTADLMDLQYIVESSQIDPFVPPTEEELKAFEAAGEPPPDFEAMEAMEERYRLIKAKVMWRGGKEQLEILTVVRVPDAGVSSR